MNPLRLDPTRTATLRRTFKRDLEVGFLWLAKKIEELVITDDMFDLTSNAASCGAGVPGKPGFQNGNTCAVGEFTYDKGAFKKGPDPRGLTEDHIAYSPAIEWVQEPSSLLKDAISSWIGSPSMMRLHMKDEINGDPILGSGTGKIARAQAKQLLKTVIEESNEAPTLYRGDDKEPSSMDVPVLGWTSSKKEATKWAKKYQGKVYTLKGAKGVEIAKVPGVRTPFGHEKEWLVLHNIPEDFKSRSVTRNARFKFKTSKLEEFNKWLDLKIKAGVLNKEAIYKNIGAGHSQGMSRGYGDKRRLRSLLSSSGAVTAGAKQEFFSSARLKANSLQNLQARAFQDLKGITEAMAAQISQVLSDGMLTGKSKEDIALSLVDRVQKIGITRARALVETEITRAHSEGVLDALESLGDTHVSINVEWHTTDNPCELCAPLRHLILTIEQARGMFPRHVNCKCSPVPTKERSHRSKIKASIDRSVMAEVPQKKKKVRKSKLQQRRRSSWFGANK